MTRKKLPLSQSAITQQLSFIQYGIGGCKNMLFNNANYNLPPVCKHHLLLQ
jgi:hypothetical protein